MWSRPEARQAAPRRAATERAVQGPFISNSVTRWRISCRASPFGGAPRARRKGKWGGGMRLLISLLWFACMGAAALADACPHHPDAIGTGRSITVDPGALPRIGTMQYKDTLPLADHEVVITFDDGPLPPFTTHVLATLRENCAKATFFLVGAMARAYPWVVRRIYNDGHTIGTHSENHPFALNRRSMAFVEREVEGGIASVTAAVGDPRAVAPFFRVPGLARSDPIETFLAARSLAVWSADEVADDWFHGIAPDQIVRRALDRLEKHDHRGACAAEAAGSAAGARLPHRPGGGAGRKAGLRAGSHPSGRSRRGHPAHHDGRRIAPDAAGDAHAATRRPRPVHAGPPHGGRRRCRRAAHGEDVACGLGRGADALSEDPEAAAPLLAGDRGERGAAARTRTGSRTRACLRAAAEGVRRKVSPRSRDRQEISRKGWCGREDSNLHGLLR